MFLLVIHVVLLPTQHLCFDTQKFYWAYAASPVHILYGRRSILSHKRELTILRQSQSVKPCTHLVNVFGQTLATAFIC